MADLKQEVDHLRSRLWWFENKPPRETRVNGHVYAIRVSGYIKIGWTSDLAKRMRQYPPDSTLMATMPGTRDDERRVHQSLDTHRAMGREWFALTPPVMDWIKRTAGKHGQPEQPDWSAKPVEVPRPHSTKPFSASRYAGKPVA